MQNGKDVSRASPVRIEAVPPDGLLVAVCFLGRVWGCFTHWIGSARGKGDSELCLGALACPKARHAREKVWKGFAAAEVYSLSQKVWTPCVFEITESTWEMLQGYNLRGQTWIMRRGSNPEKPKEVSGFLEGQRQAELCQEEFDPLPVIQRRYRVIDFPWGIDPDLPPAVYRAPVQAPPPQSLQADDTPPKFTEIPDRAKAKQMLEDFRKNGYHAK